MQHYSRMYAAVYPFPALAPDQKFEADVPDVLGALALRINFPPPTVYYDLAFGEASPLLSAAFFTAYGLTLPDLYLLAALNNTFSAEIRASPRSTVLAFCQSGINQAALRKSGIRELSSDYARFLHEARAGDWNTFLPEPPPPTYSPISTIPHVLDCLPTEPQLHFYSAA